MTRKRWRNQAEIKRVGLLTFLIVSLILLGILVTGYECMNSNFLSHGIPSSSAVNSFKWYNCWIYNTWSWGKLLGPPKQTIIFSPVQELWPKLRILKLDSFFSLHWILFQVKFPTRVSLARFWGSTPKCSLKKFL